MRVIKPLLMTLLMAFIALIFRAYAVHMEGNELPDTAVVDKGNVIKLVDEEILTGQLDQLKVQKNNILIFTSPLDANEKDQSKIRKVINAKLKSSPEKFQQLFLVQPLDTNYLLRTFEIKGTQLKQISSKKLPRVENLAELIANELKSLVIAEAKKMNLPLTEPVIETNVSDKELWRKISFLITFLFSILIGIWRIQKEKPWAIYQGIGFVLAFHLLGMAYFWLPTFFFLGVALAYGVQFRKRYWDWRLNRKT